MVVVSCFGSYILQSNLTSRQKQIQMHNEAAIEKFLESVTSDK